jgi:hyperosmotically inducible protein
MRTMLIALVLLAGCAQPPGEPQPKLRMRALGQDIAPPGQPSDETIGMEIRRRLAAVPAETAAVIVEVEAGHVTLRGVAPNPGAAWRAEAAARSVKGVKTVTNQILVSSPLAR